VIAKEEYTENEFIIDIELIADWLNLQKGNLKRVLKSNFEEDYDYTTEKTYIKSKVGSTMKEDILLTPNCFKELCMIFQSKRAKEVRKYFIEMEKLIKRYYETIKETMYKEIVLLKNNQKPKKDYQKEELYVIEVQNTATVHKLGKMGNIKEELYKIGKSGDIKQRLVGYNTRNANDILQLFIIPVKDIKSAEDCIKIECKRFQYRKYKEVYQINYKVLVDSLETCKLLTDGLAKHFEE
jgi:phage anti-repressor protein